MQKLSGRLQSRTVICMQKETKNRRYKLEKEALRSEASYAHLAMCHSKTSPSKHHTQCWCSCVKKKRNNLQVVLATLLLNTPGNASYMKLTRFVAKTGLECCHIRLERIEKVVVQTLILKYEAGRGWNMPGQFQFQLDFYFIWRTSFAQGTLDVLLWMWTSEGGLACKNLQISTSICFSVEKHSTRHT